MKRIKKEGLNSKQMELLKDFLKDVNYEQLLKIDGIIEEKILEHGGYVKVLNTYWLSDNDYSLLVNVCGEFTEADVKKLFPYAKMVR
jgi:hypothetical protein